MRKFSFPLESVLQLKRQGERLAEIQEMVARTALARAQGKVETVERQIADVASEMEAQVGASVPPEAWHRLLECSRSLAEHLRLAQIEVGKAEKSLEAAYGVRVRLARDVEALRILRLRHLAEYKRDRLHQSQAGLDEFAIQRWDAPGPTQADGGPP